MRTVTFKSIPRNFEKEIRGIKPNTVREFDEKDKRFQGEDPVWIIIQERGTKRRFKRELTDVTYWGNIVIYSWKHIKLKSWGF